MDRRSRDAVRQLNLAILEKGTVRLSGHARDRMAQRGLTEEEIRDVLRAGWADDPEFGKGSWRYVVRTPQACAVIAFRREDTLVVLTAWSEN